MSNMFYNIPYHEFDTESRRNTEVHGQLYVDFNQESLEELSEDEFQDIFPDARVSYLAFQDILMERSDSNKLPLVDLLGEDIEVHKEHITNEVMDRGCGSLYVAGGDLEVEFSVDAELSMVTGRDNTDLTFDDLCDDNKRLSLKYWMDYNRPEAMDHIFGLTEMVPLDTDMINLDLKSMISNGEKNAEKMLDTLAEKYDMSVKDYNEMCNIYTDALKREVRNYKRSNELEF